MHSSAASQSDFLTAEAPKKISGGGGEGASEREKGKKIFLEYPRAFQQVLPTWGSLFSQDNGESIVFEFNF